MTAWWTPTRLAPASTSGPSPAKPVKRSEGQQRKIGQFNRYHLVEPGDTNLGRNTFFDNEFFLICIKHF